MVRTRVCVRVWHGCAIRRLVQVEEGCGTCGGIRIMGRGGRMGFRWSGRGEGEVVVGGFGGGGLWGGIWVGGDGFGSVGAWDMSHCVTNS